MNNPFFDEALASLWVDCESLKPPQIVIQGIVSILENSDKLFCWVGNVDSAIGTTCIPSGLYASDLFVKLIEAIRALDWKIVTIILKQANFPLQTATTTALAHP